MSEHVITEKQWEQAKQHFDEVYRQYRKVLKITPYEAVTTLRAVFYPAAERYQEGERTPELYKEMTGVE